MKFLKILLWIVLVIIVFLIGVWGISLWVFDAHSDTIKLQLEQKFNENTNCVLNVKKIDLSLFPTIGVRLVDAKVTSSKQSADNLVGIKDAVVAVKVLPLLWHKIEVKKIIINGFNVNFTRFSKTQTNWQKLQNKLQGHGNLQEHVAKKSSKTNAEQKSITIKSPYEQINKFQKKNKWQLKIGKININDANINFVDHVSNMAFNLHGFSFKTNDFALNKPFKIAVKFNAAINGAHKVKIKFIAPSIEIDLAKAQLEAHGISLAINNDSKIIGGMDLDFKPYGFTSGFELSSSALDVSQFVYLQGARAVFEHLLVHGRVNYDDRLFENTKSNNKREFLKGFMGSIEASAKGATIYGIDLGQLVQAISNNVNEVINKGSVNLSGLLTLASLHIKGLAHNNKILDAKNGQKTVFKPFAITSVLTNGFIKNYLINLQGDNFAINGSGQVDLIRQFVDYKFKASLYNQDSKNEFTVPIVVNGPFANVYYGINKEAINSWVKSKIWGNQKNKVGGKVSNTTANVVNAVKGFFGNFLK